MKRILCLCLSLLLTVGTMSILFSCGETAATEKATEKATDKESASVDETATGTPKPMPLAMVTVSSAAAAPQVETETEHTYVYAYDEDGHLVYKCFGCGDVQKTFTEEEHRALLYEQKEDVRQEVIGYGYSFGPEDYESRLLLMKEAGVTGIVAGEFHGAIALAPMLEACKKTGMDAYVDCFAMDGKRAADKFLMFEGLLDCVKGIYLKDEPLATEFPAMADLVEKLRERVPEAENWKMAPNLFPPATEAYEIWATGTYGYQIFDWYETYDGVSKREGENISGWYRACVAVFDMLGCDHVGFDFYPLAQDGKAKNDQMADYVSMVVTEKKIALEHDNAGCWTYLQSSDFGRNDWEHTYTFEQIAAELNLSLACGADTVVLFTVETASAENGHTGLIDKDGEITPTYGKYQKAIAGVNAMKGIQKDFVTEGVMTVNLPRYDEKILARETPEMLLSSFDRVANVETQEDSSCLIGCAKDEEGRVGLYLVNTYYTVDTPSTYTLTLDEDLYYQVWGTEGLEQIGNGQTVTVTVAAGCGAFIVIGGDNLPD